MKIKQTMAGIQTKWPELLFSSGNSIGAKILFWHVAFQRQVNRRKIFDKHSENSMILAISFSIQEQGIQIYLNWFLNSIYVRYIFKSNKTGSHHIAYEHSPKPEGGWKHTDILYFNANRFCQIFSIYPETSPQFPVIMTLADEFM